MDLAAAKALASKLCVDNHVTSGQRIGIGTGTTIVSAIDRISELYAAGTLKDIVCVPSSFQARQLILSHNLPLSDLDRHPELDIYIDGADEVDSSLNCIKGGGGCLTKEKIVMASAKTFYIVGDYRKKSRSLGDQWHTIPLEVVPEAYRPIMGRILSTLGGKIQLRQAGACKAGPCITDNMNFILDWEFPRESPRSTDEWRALHTSLKLMPGMVETGLFVQMASKAYFGMQDGSVSELTSPSGPKVPFALAQCTGTSPSSAKMSPEPKKICNGASLENSA